MTTIVLFPLCWLPLFKNRSVKEKRLFLFFISDWISKFERREIRPFRLMTIERMLLLCNNFSISATCFVTENLIRLIYDQILAMTGFAFNRDVDCKLLSLRPRSRLCSHEPRLVEINPFSCRRTQWRIHFDPFSSPCQHTRRKRRKMLVRRFSRIFCPRFLVDDLIHHDRSRRRRELSKTISTSYEDRFDWWMIDWFPIGITILFNEIIIGLVTISSPRAFPITPNTQ
jgi:hypothetical protein